MNEIRERVARWSSDIVDECIQNWELMEEQGSLHECTLRKLARVTEGCKPSNIVAIMHSIAFECYRVQMYRYKEELEDIKSTAKDRPI